MQKRKRFWRWCWSCVRKSEMQSLFQFIPKLLNSGTDCRRFLHNVQAGGADEGCVTFVLHEEDHTLGNSLRYMIMKNPEVEFCGYSITHPSESKINFRIQTRGGLPATETLRKGLNDLTDVCKHVLHTFEAQVKEFKEKEGEAME